ncbi:unnamed protein product [Calicophoron daubneyi]|uniref:Protein N-terminal glutamine amidohydrolase n=1 Tax=Calicophoron daubneyi TaxID=300641 RepID=A0AAV2TUR9_CALDB
MRREEFMYTPNYCEENIYTLLQRLKETQPDGDFYVLFISNPSASVAIFRQLKGSPDLDGLVVWDYHVVLLQGPKASSVVYDFDTTLAFPTSFKTYFELALRSNSQIPIHLQRLYRLIAANLYLEHFSSDRRHMRRQDGSWIAPPPANKCIRGSRAASEHTLPNYLDMTFNPHPLLTSEPYGSVIHEYNLLERFF